MKYVLNSFLWNLLKISGAKINHPKVYESIQLLKFDMSSKKVVS